MKKIIKILLPFLVASSAVFSGCKKKDKTDGDSRVLISFGDVHASETRQIGLTKLAEITNAKENFLLVVSTNTCGCWDDFRPVLNSYISTKKVVCYRIDFNDIKDATATYGLANVSSSTTTFAVFENGKVKTFLNTADDKNIMYDQTKFAKYMEETIILPSCYFITKDDVSTIKSSNKNAVIYFQRSECGDCTALNPLLISYLKDHKSMNKLYTIDCQQYWRSSEAEDYQSYLDFKDEMGLSTTNNPTYGYSTGVFPFFSYISNGQYSSGCVIYNDSISKVDDKIIVSQSYYTTERVQHLEYTSTVIQGLELSANEVTEAEYQGYHYYKWKQESKDSRYKGILDSFLDYALPKETFNF